MSIRNINPQNSQDVGRFLDFPLNLYRHHPYWVPEIRSSARLIFDRKRHPYYRHSDSAFFLVENQGKVVGRLAALHNRNYCNHYKQEIGFFTCFDAIDDQAVANELFNAAAEWMKKRGIVSILGPRGFLRSQGFGLLIEGFDHLPAVGIPYNFAYYQKLIEGFGFTKEADILSGYMVRTDALPDKVFLAADKIAEKGNLRVLKFKHKRELLPWITKVDTVYREAFLDNPNYFPTTPEEFELMVKNIYQIADPRLIKIIVHGDEIAGFLLAYPNINRALQKIGGRLFPFGWITLLKEIRSTRRVDLNGLGLLPRYQGRGGNILLYAEVERTLRAFDTDHAEMVQVDERNFNSFSDMTSLGVHVHKRHRLYCISL